MKLSAFIDANLDPIVAEWEAFARTPTPAATSMAQLALHDRRRELLIAIAADMRMRRTEDEPQRPAEPGPAASPTIAAAQGALRHAAGFGLEQAVSEFHALRSIVLTLWRRCVAEGDTASATATATEEIAHFDEAVDRALAESVRRCSTDLAASRDMFLAVLAHDLRSPLQVIEIASHALTQPELPDATRLQVGMRVQRASKAMNRLISDLLDFTRSRLGRGMPVERSICDLGQLCEDALDAVRSGYPAQEFVQQRAGDLLIAVDAARLQQALSNLLNNAVQHGSPHAAVSLSARGEEHAVVLVVANAGKPILPDALRVIFDPLVQMPGTTADLSRRPGSSLGLGLFIVREIVLGHQGTIEVESSAEVGTAFTVRLPRVPPQR